MAEPDAETLNQAGLARRLRRWALATRPAFLMASVLPVLAGTAWGVSIGGTFDVVAFLLALVTVVLAHGGINVMNDVYDDDIGTDNINTDRIFPFTSGSRFIQNDVLSRLQMARLGAALLTLALMLGLLLAALKGWPVLALGAGAVALGLLYSAPPIMLAGRGLGEVAVGIGFGPVPVIGAAWLQSAMWPTAENAGVVVLSLIIGIWAVLILLINEVPDAMADGETGNRTLVVRLGKGKTAVLYYVLHVLVALLVGVMIYFDWISPIAIMLPVLFLGIAQRAAHAIANSESLKLNEQLVPMTAAIKTTLVIHAVGTLWLAGWALAGYGAG